MIYQCDEAVEIPQRCMEFVEQICRNSSQTLNLYILRHQPMMAKMRAVQPPAPEST